MRIKQSLCYPIFASTGLSLDELFGIAADLGFAAVELWFRDAGFAQVAATARKHDLAIASMCGHHALADGLNKRSNHDRIIDELKASIDVAAENSIPGLI